MDFRGYRVKVVVFALLGTLALLAIGATLVDRTMVQRPLARLLEQRAEIEHYDILTRNGTTCIMVRLGDVPDWPDFYASLGEDLRVLLGARPYQLVWEDNRSETLSQAYARMHFALREAAVRGTYVHMAQEVADIAGDLELDAHALFVSEQGIFLELKHQGHRLYEVIERVPGGSDA